MALSLRRGRVTAIGSRDETLVRLEVDDVPCIAYPRLTGDVEVGDEVLVNEQARALGLGSGGFDVLYANLTRGLGLAAEEGAHVMKLPYTPLQVAVRHGEEEGELPEGLGGMPVVCCSVHSQLAPVCAGLGPGVRVAYVQVPGGALPVSLSDSVRELKARGLLEVAIAAGACLDGDVDCVSVASALAWAAGSGAEAIVCSVGPGVVGTGSALGHGGVAAAEAANAASALDGVADPRGAGVRARRARTASRRLASLANGTPARARRRRRCLAGRSDGSRVARAARGGRRDGLGGGLRRADALAHGSRPGGGSVALRGRVRGGEVRSVRLGRGR